MKRIGKYSKLLTTALLLLLLPTIVLAAATAVIAPNPKFIAYDSNGDPLVGGKLYTYATTTTTPKTTWTDSTKGTPNTNPIILDSYGQADVWIDSTGGAYRFKLDTSAGVTLWTKDGISDSRDLVFTTAEFLVGHSSAGVHKGYRLVSEFDDFDDAISDLGATETELWINEDEIIADDITVPQNISLVFLRENQLSTAAGKTLTIYSPANIIAAPNQHIFSGLGTVAFTVKNGWVSPFWWGAVNDPADDSTDSGAAFNAALATGANVRIPAGTYSTTTGIVQNTTGQTTEAYGVTLRVNADVIGWQLGVTGGGSNVSRCNLLGDIHIRNYSGSSTKAALRLESVTYSEVHYNTVYDFNYGVELISSGSLGCVYNNIYAGYTHTNDATDGYPVYLNLVNDVTGYIFNNNIYSPKVWGTYKYGIYIKKRASGATNTVPVNNSIYHPIISGTGDRGIYNDGKTNIYGGHYENTQNVLTTIPTATYTWNLSGSGTAEYYVTPALPDGFFLFNGATVKEGSTALVWDSIGGLEAGDFGYGDNDNIGYNTLYVRLSDDTQPGDEEVSYIDPNDIYLTSNSSSCYVIANDLNAGITNAGTYNEIHGRQLVVKDFQDNANAQIMRYKRVGQQVYSGSSPMQTLEDNYSGSGYSYLNKWVVGRAVDGSYVYRLMNGSGVESAALLGSGVRRSTSPKGAVYDQEALYETEHVITAGASNTIDNVLPAGAIIKSVLVRVTEVITSAGAITGFSIGHNINTAAVPTDADAWGANIAVAANTTTSVANFTIAGPIYNNSAVAAEVTLTAVGANFDGTTGKVRVTIAYDLPAAPTS